MPEEEITNTTTKTDGTQKKTEEKKDVNLHLTELQRNIFDSIAKSDVLRLKQYLIDLKTSIDFYDDSGMTPLQHAAYKGNKEAVQLLLDRGANCNSSKHQYAYTALHFAALSGSADVCMQLLLAGSNISALNSVQKTPSQMAAFVGNKLAVQTINNFIPREEIAYYTKLQGIQTEPYLPPFLIERFHQLTMQLNLYPVRIALNLQKSPVLLDHLDKIKKVLNLMSEREAKRGGDVNEILAFKMHYLAWIVGEIQRCRDSVKSKEGGGQEKKTDYIEAFIKKVLKPAKEGQMDYTEVTIRDCVREFSFRELTVFRQIVGQLVNKNNTLTAFEILKQSLMGHNAFADQITNCNTCGEENPTKKCSKCKLVSYCDRECQRLHWFVHKKVCDREITSSTTSITKSDEKEPIDVAELQGVLQQMRSD